MKELKKAKVSKKMLDAVGGNMVLAQILTRRGISEEEVPVFLNPTYTPPLRRRNFRGWRKR